MSWIEAKKYVYRKAQFQISYDTAIELGMASAEIWYYHGELIENPYDPMNVEFDQFNDAKMDRLMELRLNNQQ